MPTYTAWKTNEPQEIQGFGGVTCAVADPEDDGKWFSSYCAGAIYTWLHDVPTYPVVCMGPIGTALVNLDDNGNSREYGVSEILND